MLPVHHVARATILRSLSSRRLTNSLAARHRLVFRSAHPHQTLQLRHYARLVEDGAPEAAIEVEKPTKISVPKKGPFLCPFSYCPRSERAFARKANLLRHIGTVHKDESGIIIDETPRKPRAQDSDHGQAQPSTDTNVVSEITIEVEPLQEEVPPPVSTFGSLLSALENSEPPKRRTPRRKIVDAELQPEGNLPAKKDAAEIETPSIQTPPTISTFENLLGSLENEEPRKPRARRKRVTDVETQAEEEPPSQVEATPGLLENDPFLPPAPVTRKLGRPVGSKDKASAAEASGGSPVAEPEQPILAPAKRKAGRPAGSKNKTTEERAGEKPRTRRGSKSEDKDPVPQPGYTADCVNTTYLEQALIDSGVWHKRKDLTSSAARARQQEMRKHTDASRVNIVSEALCDDILQYMKPGLLDRHKGCDILDINPGAGLWSRKLNDMLQPRRHVLVEEDYGFYEPFLKPLVEREGTKVAQVPGIVWKDLFSTLDEGQLLPEQKVTRCEVDEMPERNDTLLVTMNLLTKSKRKIGSSTFGTMAGLVLYQLMASVRSQGLFQRYGLVRMLVWVDDQEKTPYLPKTVQRRRVGAIQAELSMEWITEVAGMDQPDDGKQYAYRRDQHIDMDSMGATLERMEEAGYRMPEGRETDLFNTYLALKKEGNLTSAGEQTPIISKKYEDALQEMETLKVQKVQAGTWTPADNLALLRNRWLSNQNKKRQGEIGELLFKLDRLTELKIQLQEAEEKNESAAAQIWEQFTELEAELEQTWEGFDQLRRNRFLVARDNLRAFKQPLELGPVLMWDRRYVEPLAVKPGEFYPPVHGALLDIQPRSMESTLRSTCSHGSKVYDQLDLILRHLQLSAASPLGPTVDGVYHGAREGVADLTKSLHDFSLGGTPLKGPIGELDMRALSRTQIVEFIDKWQQWPFKPTFPELVGRLAENDEEPDPDGGGGGGMFGDF
ncbi:hypothetical protein QBC40DRAFT_275108 [Triangularia verruculosa]|uniref:Mitochondrial transcription factor 1 n=1 Tax=Triangularia verruculosa TaxID=2587418 RepID=A0AAN7AYG4_9PEZI|nr:hypothetical protein QBC40DRAFT_275108 [Triangularia verruculosa]